MQVFVPLPENLGERRRSGSSDTDVTISAAAPGRTPYAAHKRLLRNAMDHFAR
ncbi:hypothetical protein ACH4M0_22250 [Streptomyces albidoflavus]